MLHVLGETLYKPCNNKEVAGIFVIMIFEPRVECVSLNLLERADVARLCQTFLTLYVGIVVSCRIKLVSNLVLKPLDQPALYANNVITRSPAVGRRHIRFIRLFSPAEDVGDSR